MLPFLIKKQKTSLKPNNYRQGGSTCRNGSLITQKFICLYRWVNIQE